MIHDPYSAASLEASKSGALFSGERLYFTLRTDSRSIGLRNRRHQRSYGRVVETCFKQHLGG